jgi:hypothetical protein
VHNVSTPPQKLQLFAKNFEKFAHIFRLLGKILQTLDPFRILKLYIRKLIVESVKGYYIIPFKDKATHR